ncbi:hypothetical protein BGW37DRAFT_559789 [Umbelopsis sp. PMI_123]|nr:hypothetical protein BGW37DRAFT_559789 [Umbelopsis sp. PMI_123]
MSSYHEKRCLSSQECQSIAAALLGNIDDQIDPYQDFIQFSCGGWLKSHEIPDDKLHIGAHEELSKRNSKTLRRILEHSYSDLKRLNSNIRCLQASPLHPLLEKLGTIFENNAKNNRAAITRAFAYLNQFSITPLIKFAVYSDISHPDTYGVYVFQSGLMLSIREKYNDSSILELYRNAATETWFKISQNFDLPGIDSDIDISCAVETAINFENHISLIANSSQELSNPLTTNNPITLNSLNEMAPIIDWELLISLLHQNYNPIDTLIITSPYIYSAIIPISCRNRHHGRGKELPKCRELCIQNTDAALGQLVGQFFVLVNFSLAAKDSVNEAIALDKLHKIIQKIGYGTSSPDVMTPDSLYAYYQSITAIPGQFLKIISRLVNGQLESHGNCTVKKLTNEYHGFDTAGRFFDGDGKARTWWRMKTEQQFLETAQCFIDQYSSFTLTGPKNASLRLNGRCSYLFESGEILADNGGLQISYNAWQNSLRDGIQSRLTYQSLATLEKYTPEQLFFISFGQNWCSKVRPEYAAIRVSSLAL